MKKWLCLLMCVMLCMPAACAETWVEDTGAVYVWRYTTFEQEAPPELAQALQDAGFGVVRGAVRTSEPAGADVPANIMPDDIALVAAQGPQGLTLLGMWRSMGQPWKHVELGGKMLLEGRGFTITFSRQNTRLDPVWVEYPTEDGGVERYGFWWGVEYDDMWTLECYEREAADGSGLRISNAYSDGGFRVSGPRPSHGEGTVYPANWIGWTAYMDSITEYPTTEEAARALADRSWQGLDGRDVALLYGNVNLRERPTGSSRSLGKYRGAVVHVLGQEPGREFQWLKVSVGGVEGYVSANYARFPRTEDYHLNLWHGPLPLARLETDAVLRPSPSGSAQAVRTLAAGDMLQVLCRRDDGWLHVALYSGSWQMDPDAQCGYVKESEVTVGSAVSLGVR